jgi:predicted transcriptional regulator
MPTPMEKATAYLSKLEADRLAATAMSKEKAQEAMLIKAREEGFREAMEIFGANVTSDDKGVGTDRRREERRDIRQMIIQELSFSGKAMTKQQIAKAIDYIPERTEVALKRLEGAGRIIQNREGSWEVVLITAPHTNGHAVGA